MCPKFPDICLRVEEKPRENFNQEIDPTRDRVWARCVRGNDATPQTTEVVSLNRHYYETRNVTEISS